MPSPGSPSPSRPAGLISDILSRCSDAEEAQALLLFGLDVYSALLNRIEEMNRSGFPPVFQRKMLTVVVGQIPKPSPEALGFVDALMLGDVTEEPEAHALFKAAAVSRAKRES